MEMHIPAGTTASISTGLTIAVPAGLEAQARASSSLPDGLLVQRLRAAAIGERQEITVVVSNVGTEVITVRPGDMIAQLTFTPIIRATLHFAPHENAALPATAAQYHKQGAHPHGPPPPTFHSIGNPPQNTSAHT